MRDMKKIFPTIFLAAVSLSAGLNAKAAGLIPCGGVDDACTICDLFQLINNIIKMVILALVPSIAVLVIAIAGFKMLLNQNNSDVLNESKDIIVKVIIGVVLIYASYAIVNTMFAAMGYVGGNPLQFNNVKCD